MVRSIENFWCKLLVMMTVSSFGYSEDIFHVNGVECMGTKAINKMTVSKKSILQQIPDKMLSNQDPRSYPTCDLIVPWTLINSSAVTMDFAENWILILVKSAPQNIKRRSVIRQTWGSFRAVGKRNVFTLFVVARPGNHADRQNALEQENIIYGDMLQCDMEDSYDNLPLKVLSMMGWFLSYNITANFVIVTDDDVALKVPTVLKFFEDHKEDSTKAKCFCGFVYSSNSSPIRGESKWRMPKEIYPGSKYPIFCNGPNYSMTKSLMHDLFCAASITDYDGFYLEDVLITGILRAKLNNKNEDIDRGGTFIQYFWNQDIGVQNLIKQTWNKWTKTEKNLKEILDSKNTIFADFKRDFDNAIGIEKFWDSVIL